MTNQSTSLSIQRILMTLALYFIMPWGARLLDILLQNQTISQTVMLHTITLLLVILNFDILDLHARRLKGKIGDFLFFSILALFCTSLIAFFNQQWLHASVWTPQEEVLHTYTFFIPTILLAYSFSYAVSFMITFKSITDRFKIQLGEKLIIFFSGVFVGLFAALSQCPQWQLSTFIPLFIYFTLISIIGSYTYNQTHSILPMILGYGLSLMLWLL